MDPKRDRNFTDYSNLQPIQRAREVKKPARKLTKKTLVIFFALVVLALVELTVIVWRLDGPKSSDHKSNSTTSNPSNTVTNSPSFDKTKYSTAKADSLWTVVNKGRVLPADYAPTNLVAPNVPLRSAATNAEMHLRPDAASAMEKMFAAAAEHNIHLRLASGYRSYSEQVAIYAREVKNNGQAGADRESARPGHSEHQTGLAADLEPASRVCEIADCFADTPEGKWLAANCYKYGFIIRYQDGKENLTGYKYEPWHVRYIGTELAAQIYKTDQTLEQFFGLPEYTDYPPNSFKLR